MAEVIRHQAWNDAESETACKLWKAGHSATEIMRELTNSFGRKFTRNSVISRLYRLMPEGMTRAAASGARNDLEVVARARGGSRSGQSIFTAETDDLLLKTLAAGRNSGDAARLIMEATGKIYTPGQLNDRARALKYRSNRIAQRKTNPHLAPIFTPEVEDEIRRQMARQPAPNNQSIALSLRELFPDLGLFTQKTVTDHKRHMRETGELPEATRGKIRWPKAPVTMADAGSFGAVMVKALQFKPENRLDFEWGAEALSHWSDPALDDATARWLLRPGRRSWRDFGFYIEQDGRVESAWWLYTGGEIDILSLQAAAKRYFAQCNLSEEDNARLWRRRFRARMDAAGIPVMDLRRRLKGISATPWATLESMIYGTSPGSTAGRRELETALTAAIEGCREIAA